MRIAEFGMRNEIMKPCEFRNKAIFGWRNAPNVGHGGLRIADFGLKENGF